MTVCEKESTEDVLCIHVYKHNYTFQVLTFSPLCSAQCCFITHTAHGLVVSSLRIGPVHGAEAEFTSSPIIKGPLSSDNVKYKFKRNCGEIIIRCRDIT